MIYPSEEEKPPRFQKPLLVAAAVAVVALFAGAGWYVYTELFTSKEPPPVVTPSTLESQAERLPERVEGRYLFTGTTVWARAVEKYARGDFAQPFSQLHTLEREKYDAWSTDFECPITENVVPYDVQVNNLVFNCRPEFLSEASKYFNLYDLANNHTDNQGGQTGITSTRASMEKAGVQYFGNYDPTITEDICEVIALPVRVQLPDGKEQKKSLPVAFCAWHLFNYFRGPRPEELAVVQQYAELMPVFGFAEMGLEYKETASPDIVSNAHQMIDAGSDVLFANNPHWVQNTEVYKDKLIVYSLGNFIFDQLDTETNRGASIDTSLTVPYDPNVAKWLALAPSCAVFKDDCLARAKQQGLKKVSFNLKYAVVASQGGAGKVTHKADAATQAAVEARMNWPQTLKALGQ